MKLALVGLGLIGGSFALALKAAGLPGSITGYDRSEADARLALSSGAVDAVAASPADAVAGADVVVLAAPVMALRQLLADIAPHLTSGAIVTDVASTKAMVAAWAAELLPPHARFVGGHPMAGSEKSGMAAARADLFQGATYCVTGGEPEAVAVVERLATAVGGRVLPIDAEAHDAAVAAVSHVPFLAATAIVAETAHDPRWDVWSGIAATGYRDMTRLAAGSPDMYRDICRSNGGAIAPTLRALAARLNAIADHLDDPGYLDPLFHDARERRQAWQQLFDARSRQAGK